MTVFPLAFERLTLAYGSNLVATDLRLGVGPGEIVGLFGRNGSGKSTVLKAVAGVLKPIDGVVSLLGVDVTAKPTHRRIRQGLAYLPQRRSTFPSLTVAETFRLAARLHPGDIRPPTQGLIKEQYPPLGEHWRRRVGLLSGGQRQFLAVASLLSRSPSVLLLDEPFAGLASDLAATLAAQLRQHVRETGAAVLLVEQDTATTISIAHRLLRMDSGTFTDYT